MSRPTIEDLLGGGKPSPILDRTGRKTKPYDSIAQNLLPDPPPRNIPVGVTWLGRAFRMERGTVHKRLATCPPVAYGTTGAPLYDFVEAAAYLVTPKVDFEAVMKSTRKEDMPPHLQKQFWDAKNGELRYSRAAGDMWHTQDVLEVLGDVFTHFKTSLQLFTENLERSTGLTTEQRTRVMEMADSLQDDMHKKLVGMPKERQTLSVFSHRPEDEEDDALPES